MVEDPWFKPKQFSSVRPPAVAGAFYPLDKEVLYSQIDEFLGNVPKQETKGNLRILIVPHAGYSYSGSVAAFGFKQLQGKNFSRVVLIGGSHQAQFSKVVIDKSTHWQTPLGKVEVDWEFAQKLIDANSIVSKDSAVHAAEHSLEVELPFLQHVLNQFKIVPILLGDDSKKTAQALADALACVVDDSTLIVVSTDFSHYPLYQEAKIVDKKTIDAILEGDVMELERIITEQMTQGIPNLATCACGGGAVKTGMFLALNLVKDGKWRLLKYVNSGDISGDYSRVVGYAAIAFFATVSTEELNYNQQVKLLEIARKTLETYLAERKVPEFEIEDEQLNQPAGAFVTLRKNGRLRGCIGEFEPSKPLWQAVREKAIDAVTCDPRFLPVTAEELPDIKIEISVLSPRQKVSSPSQIELGKHGVVIQKGNRSGVFLPQVATETGWDLEELLGQLCSQKAGLPWDCWKDKNVSLFIFTAQVFAEIA